ncbi:MAG TPA: alpha/beta hydrolase [Geobacterales bacterium]|nr:alpha/beta hydrolase [Geobacterales bacterium]
MPLDPKLRELISAGFNLPVGKVDVQELRRIFREISRGEKLIEVKKVEEIKIHGSEADIKARIYYPFREAPYGILIYYHGGGFVIGDLDTYDNVCRAITRASDALVISVDYRLAPEHKFPAAIIDSFDALKWVNENASSFNANKGIAIAGDSAGGNIAAVLAILARNNNIELKQQILIYPTVGIDLTSRSMTEFSKGYFLENDHIIWFASQYFAKPEDVFDFRFSPILAQDFKNLAPALVITAEYDPLRDQGEVYAAKLAEAGVQVTSVRFNGVTHGFLSFFYALEQGKDAIGLIGATLRRLFYNSY